MKELSIEQKAQRYDELLVKLQEAKVDNNVCNDRYCCVIDDIVPELKESEDERIRKTLIQIFNVENFENYDIKNEEVIAWLEKQGEQKPYGQRQECVDCQFNYAGECKGSCAMKRGEQKSIDTVEPKFKIGDWIVCCDYEPEQIIGIRTNVYEMSNGDIRPFYIIDNNHNIRIWTIQDAKDGDVFAFDNETIVIFKDLYNATTFHSYCHIEDGVFTASEKDVPDWWEGKGFQPATKEQRDLLFQKMKEAGYEWDADKKELKKIEQKPAWSEEDEERINSILFGISYTYSNGHYPKDTYQKDINWLKSLRPQNTWKPSDEQMKQLCWIAEQNKDNMIGKELMTLYQDLKKLREE